MLWRTPDSTLDEIIERLVVAHRADAIVAHDDFLASALLRRLRGAGYACRRTSRSPAT